MENLIARLQTMLCAPVTGWRPDRLTQLLLVCKSGRRGPSCPHAWHSGFLYTQPHRVEQRGRKRQQC